MPFWLFIVGNNKVQSSPKFEKDMIMMAVTNVAAGIEKISKYDYVPQSIRFQHQGTKNKIETNYRPTVFQKCVLANNSIIVHVEMYEICSGCLKM